MENKSQIKREIHENLNEYSALRSEILTIEQNRVTCKMYMYTVFFAVFSFALQFRSLFIVALIVLLVFQSFLNFYLWMMRKVSIYIMLFFEEERHDIHWESMQDSPEYTKLDKSFHKRFSIWISDHAAGILALITAFFDLYYIIFEIIDRGGILCGEITFADITMLSEIILLVLLCVAVLAVTHQSDISIDQDLSESIGHYKNKCYPPISEQILK